MSFELVRRAVRSCGDVSACRDAWWMRISRLEGQSCMRFEACAVDFFSEGKGGEVPLLINKRTSDDDLSTPVILYIYIYICVVRGRPAHAVTLCVCVCSTAISPRILAIVLGFVATLGVFGRTASASLRTSTSPTTLASSTCVVYCTRHPCAGPMQMFVWKRPIPSHGFLV